ncbi:hypothetical protein AB0A66_01230 [Streptomyces longwoodensis]|uniref:hypothetical protein n=1 Tax=Streptomyces longwoodensis TaxID=68231 RepID=UPI0033D2F2B0
MSSTPDAVHHRVRQEVAARTDLLWEVASELACTAVESSPTTRCAPPRGGRTAPRPWPCAERSAWTGRRPGRSLEEERDGPTRR